MPSRNIGNTAISISSITRDVKSLDLEVDFSGNGGIIKAGGEDVILEFQRYGRDKSTQINKTYIESGEYRRKFDSLTNNSDANKTLYACAKTALMHRSGTLIEDMYWIDSTSGKIVANVIDQTDKIAERVEYPASVKKVIRSSENIIALHSHPQSMPPSAADFNSCFYNNYKFGVVICHDGKVFTYSSKQEISEKLYDLMVADFVLNGADEFNAQIMALEKLSKNFEINFKEVK